MTQLISVQCFSISRMRMSIWQSFIMSLMPFTAVTALIAAALFFQTIHNWKNSPPNCSSAVDWICSHSFDTKHWYIPWSSFWIFLIDNLGGSEKTCGRWGEKERKSTCEFQHNRSKSHRRLTSMRLSRSIGLPSCNQLMSCTGCPDIIHWNWASLSTSTVCTWGCKCAVNGAAFRRKNK